MVPILIAEVRRLREPMPCGHPVTAVSSSTEGTNCCGMCVLKADRDRLQRELDEVRATIKRFVHDWMEAVTETRAQVAKGKP